MARGGEDDLIHPSRLERAFGSHIGSVWTPSGFSMERMSLGLGWELVGAERDNSGQSQQNYPKDITHFLGG